jgi:hypothetical protein
MCKTDYKYPSKLTIHRNSIYGCNYNDNDYIYIPSITINNHSKNNNSNNNIFNCDKCQKTFPVKYSLTRHIKNTNCSGNNTTNNGIKTLYNKRESIENDLTKIHNNYPINNQLINIIIEKTNKIEELLQDNKLLTENNTEIEKVKDETIIENTNDSNHSNNIRLISLNNIIINSRTEDNYINAIQLCKAGNTIFDSWYSLDTTKELIKELEKEIKSESDNEDLIIIDITDITDLIDITENSSSNTQDIWIHPDLAIQLAFWISPIFYVKINTWVRKLFTNDKVELDININLLKNTIKVKDQKIKLLEDTYLKKHNRVKYLDKNVIYMLTNEFNKKNRNYIIGKAIDLTNRLTSYNKTMDHEVIYYKSCKDEATMSIVENMVLNKLKDYKEIANRDRFILPLEKDISFFTNIIDDSIKFFL